MSTVDECRNGTDLCDVDESEDGVEDGKCQDLLGKYTCECDDGYEFDSVNGGCKGEDVQYTVTTLLKYE